MRTKFWICILTTLLSIAVISSSITSLHIVSHQSNEDTVVSAQEIVLDNHAITEHVSLNTLKLRIFQNKTSTNVIKSSQTIFSPIPHVSIDFTNNQMKHICAVLYHSSSYL
ncbi:hypothetical protein ACFOZ1_02640 [Gracilibacillus marinus]|uniref:Uncharacterized protein n=1 Tax=Gracilibacillus marinus TaxID=630535 RepID=A0ABV8VQI6_9BACI